jgi:hypothetical protein
MRIHYPSKRESEGGRARGGFTMLYEGPESGRPVPGERPTARRVWDGRVRGQADCWIAVAPAPLRSADWVYREEVTEVSTLRICHTILDDDRLVLGPADPEDEAAFSELLGVL